MPRKQLGEAHPGMSRELLKMANASEAMRVIPGWDMFNPSEKEFICLVTWYSNKAETARAINRSHNWVTNRETQNPAFKAAVKQRMMLRAHILESIGADMLGASMMRLWEMVQKDYVNKAIQLQAIKHLHQIMGYPETLKASGQAPAARQTYINAGSITMFEGIPQKEYVRDRFKVIEVDPTENTGTETDDEETDDIADLIPEASPIT
jgi:hypothetical protein